MNTLTLDNLREIVPAAFADSPADNVSDRYSFIPTEPIVRELINRGWNPVKAQQSHRVRNKQHTTHMIAFQQTNGEFNVGDYAPQVILFNNHAAQRRFCLRGGIYVKVCSNGLVICVAGSDSQLLRIHIDDAKVDIDIAFGETLKQLERAGQVIPKWRQIELSFVEQQDFAQRAIMIRNNNDKYWSNHFQVHEFLTRRRPADRLNNLWTVFNVVQENILQGGVQGAVRTTKPITQVSEIQRINESLWQLATEYGNLHGVN